MPAAASLAAAMLLLVGTPADAMPFPPSDTSFSQDIHDSDVAVIARLDSPPDRESKSPLILPLAKFSVVEVLKGEKKVAEKQQIEAPFFDEKVGGIYLILGAASPAIEWASPYPLTPRGRKYVTDILKLPSSGVKRLVYIQKYLEDSEEPLAADAKREFVLAPYSALKEMKGQMQHDKLVEWVRDTNVVSSHRRLYLTMLSVCGGPGDLPILEKLMRSDDPKLQTGLDATIACYLTLKGSEGLPLVENLFLQNKTEEFTDIFCVIMALRFLDKEEHGRIPRDRLIATTRLVLDHPKIADQAIMDLARLQDWEVMDRLVAMFKSKDPEVTDWVRAPVINYLRTCPLPIAKQHIEDLRKIDPKAVKQSEAIYTPPESK